MKEKENTGSPPGMEKSTDMILTGTGGKDTIIMTGIEKGGDKN